MAFEDNDQNDNQNGFISEKAISSVFHDRAMGAGRMSEEMVEDIDPFSPPVSPSERRPVSQRWVYAPRTHDPTIDPTVPALSKHQSKPSPAIHGEPAWLADLRSWSLGLL